MACCVLAIVCCLLGVPRTGHAGAAAQGAAPAAAPAGTDSQDLFKDGEAGFLFRIPAGYARLTQDESRDVLNSVSQRVGRKDISDRALRRPPVYFKGPADPQQPKIPAPSFAVSCAGPMLLVDPAQKAVYKAWFQEEYRKSGIKHGDIAIEVVQVDGVDSLRADHDIFDSVTNTRNQAIRVMVPGGDRSYDILFNFSPEQTAGVEAALATVLKTFKGVDRPAMDVETQGRWLRVVLWTVGGFMAGIVISLLWRTISAAGAKPGK